MKFAHLADCHIGAWKEPKLRNANSKAFTKAIELCIAQKVDFILISGDLFNTALPSLDLLKLVVIKLKELRDLGISTYIIPGSHDFSPSGKTILDVLEKADLLINVFKGKVVGKKLVLEFTTDEKTGVKITGILGKRGMLEKHFYQSLDKKSLEDEPGYKIFMFHTALTEYKPKELKMMDSAPSSFLPKNFNYYAGGHIHYVFEKREKNNLLIYPGPLFPNNFREIENLGVGSLYIITDNKPEFYPIQVYPSLSIKIKGDNKTPEQIEGEIKENIKNKEFNNTIVTIRVSGELKTGKPTDINFKSIFAELYLKSAYFVMKSTSMLSSKEFKDIKISDSPTTDIENFLIEEDLKSKNEISKKDLIKSLIILLDKEKEEGEKVNDFEHRIHDDLIKALKVDDLF
ncbi:exonuclease SbcCD subunit D [Candidatus Woesearchaeota archaeon]|nr:exonuclease SbcCD subunit D [Candidatus Woesearchaeota archaeon]MBL7050691.1 exonuclease SbcCD subunit D [Candidatus Woesearchaeota archaeon]